MSVFAGLTLFNSGPHRFVIRTVGALWAQPLRLDGLQSRIEVFTANLELQITQSGRLIGSSEADLWAQVEAIRTRCNARTNGTLVDNTGQTWTGMTLLTFRPAEAVDRGRAPSLAYTADYARLGV